ncbi:MAG: CvpA family protein [Saccharofermentanales bacterium]
MLIDLCIIGILIYQIIQGWRRGFLAVILRLGITVVALLLAALIANQISDYFTSVFFPETKITDLSQQLSGQILDQGEPIPLVLQNIGLSENRSNRLAESIGEATLPLIENLVRKLAVLLVTAITFVVIFVILRLVFYYLINRFSDLFNKIPILGTVNRVCGIVLGFLIAGLFAVLLVIVLSRTAPFSEIVLLQVSNSFLYRLLLENAIFIS